MTTIMEIWAYLKTHWYMIVGAGTALMTLLQFIVRLTPTEKDDGFVERLGLFLSKAMDVLNIPNVKKQPGTVITPDGKHGPVEERDVPNVIEPE